MSLPKLVAGFGGNTPTGFRSEKIEYVSFDGKKRKLYKLSPIDSEIITVQNLFNKFLELKSQTKLETYTIQNNMKTKTGKFYSRWGLKNILTNPVYAIADKDTLNYFKNFDIEIYAKEKDFNGKNGLMVYNKTEKKFSSNVVEKRKITDWIVAIGKHKGIISGKDWVEVQNLLIKNSDMKYRKPTVSNALLSGLLRCSLCGSAMRAKLRKQGVVDGNGRRKFTYICELKDKSKMKNCQCRNINGLEADDLVLNEIKKIIVPTSKFYKALKKISSNIFNIDNNVAQELKTLKFCLTKNQKDIELLLDKIKYVDISLLDDISDEIKKLKQFNIEIEKKMRVLTNTNYDEISDNETANIVLNILDTYFSSFDALDLNTKRNLIKLVASSITSDGENITINFIGTKKLSLDDNFPTGDSSK